MDWHDFAGIAGAYAIARTILDRGDAERAQAAADARAAQEAWEVGQQMEALVSDIDDVIVDDLNAAWTAPDPGAAVIAWARRAEPKLRRYRDRWGTWWGRSPEGDELVERWQTALDGYIEAIELIRAEDPDGPGRLVRAMTAYKDHQAWLRAQAIALGWRPEE